MYVYASSTQVISNKKNSRYKTFFFLTAYFFSCNNKTFFLLQMQNKRLCKKKTFKKKLSKKKLPKKTFKKKLCKKNCKKKNKKILREGFFFTISRKIFLAPVNIFVAINRKETPSINFERETKILTSTVLGCELSERKFSSFAGFKYTFDQSNNQKYRCLPSL